MEKEKGIQAIASATLAAFAVYMGALAVPIIVLMAIEVTDNRVMLDRLDKTLVQKLIFIRQPGLHQILMRI